VLTDRWGVADAEIARRYPCDDLVLSPVMQAWRGITVRAPSERVWAWVSQIRLAPYSYDWIDNFGRRSPTHLRPMASPKAGDPFTAVGGRPVGQVLSVDPGRQITGEIFGAVMSYVLVARDRDTRLLLKVVLARRRWLAPALSLGDLVMARRQLLNLKALAEG
jgi:hypothetical protein